MKLDPSDKANMTYSHFLQVKTHTQEAAAVVPLPGISTHFEVRNEMKIHHAALLFDLKKKKSSENKFQLQPVPST